MKRFRTFCIIALLGGAVISGFGILSVPFYFWVGIYCLVLLMLAFGNAKLMLKDQDSEVTKFVVYRSIVLSLEVLLSLFGFLVLITVLLSRGLLSLPLSQIVPVVIVMIMMYTGHLLSIFYHSSVLLGKEENN